MTANPVEQLGQALDVTGGLVGGVTAGQWDGPTPCTEMTVRDLVVHMIAGNLVFTAIMGGTPLPEARGAADKVDPDGDLAAQYAAAAAGLTAAFTVPGALERQVVVPVGPVPGIGALHVRIVEMLVHGWDLAQATGQQADFPEALAEQEIEFSRQKLGDAPPGRSPFAPPRPAPGDAPAIARLAALLGRAIPV
jgi:uncharacterized protein (TIGR03086 family)